MENIELLKSSPEEDQQLQMMLLMQMDKLPAEFLEQAYGSDDTSLMMEFSGSSSTSCSPTGNTATATMPNPFHYNNNNQLLPSSAPTSVPFSHSCVPTSVLPTSGTACGGATERPGNNNWRHGFNLEQFSCTTQLHRSAAAAANSSSKTSSSSCSSSSSSSSSSSQQQLNHQKHNSMAAMREMIFRIAAMQPIYIDPESVKPPRRRNVKISKDPQSVAARHRRERISERIRILQRLVPGGTKMDTASMLDEAIHYVNFLKTQVRSLEQAAVDRPPTAMAAGVGFPVSTSNSAGGGYNNNNHSIPLGMKGVHHVGHPHPPLLPGSHHQNIYHQQQQLQHHHSSDA